MTITEQDVLDQLKCLDVQKAYGPDAVSPRLLKEASLSIEPSWCKLFNSSSQKGLFPSMWKMANVSPLYKKDDASRVANYRPVSLLSSTSKIF